MLGWIKHGINNALGDRASPFPVSLIQIRVSGQRPPQLFFTFWCENRIVVRCPVRPVGVLHVKDIPDDGMLRGRWVEVCQVPADGRCIGSAETLLHHVCVQDVDFAKIYRAQRQAPDALVAVGFCAAFVIDFLEAAV